jgi:hypothetical protein
MIKKRFATSVRVVNRDIVSSNPHKKSLN